MIGPCQAAKPTSGATVAPMHIETQGDGTDLVLLHGGIGTGRYHWSRQLERLVAAGHRVHLPDLPGHGRSPLPQGGRYDREVLVDAVEGLLEETGPPVRVAGFSMGGHVALALAARRPELFAALVLVGVSHRDHDGLGAWRDVCRRDAGGLAVDVDLDDLARLACPVLLVRGDRDEAVDPAQYADLRATWGESAEELVVPRGGHDVQLTRAALVAPGLLDFLSRVPV